MRGNFGVFRVLAMLTELTHFLTTCLKSATLLKIWIFSPFLYISETTRNNFLKISSHNLHNIYNNIIGDELLLNFGAKFQR